MTSRRALLKNFGALPFFTGIFEQSALAGRSLLTDNKQLLDLPPGFDYLILNRKSQSLDDGYRLPARPDGMACFKGTADTWVLMCNHEVNYGSVFEGPYGFGQFPPEEAYSRLGMGGVSRTVLDPATLKVLHRNMALLGTARNCAGGVSPWGWISCEETVQGKHGYAFLCDAQHDVALPAQPITSYGKFNHEACVVEEGTHIAYLTEDRNDGCLYRFVPDNPSQPFVGRLQAMAILGQPLYDTARMPDQESHEIYWLDLPRPDSQEDDLRAQAHQLGAAVVKRGEGLWLHQGIVYFSSTSGGPVGRGQIFSLDPQGSKSHQAAGVLRLVANSKAQDQMDYPDNLTVSPWGDIYTTEDGEGEDYVRVIKPDGRILPFARNASGDGEMAGICFSPDGSTLFLNIQGRGLTLAVRGPFSSFS